MRRWREDSGQATSEYVARRALVGVALTLAAGLTAGGVGGQVLAGLQRGLCRVTGTSCPRVAPPPADLDPCPLVRLERAEQLGTTLALLHLGTRGALSVVRGSDGRVTVTLAHGSDAGLEAGVGARLRIGGRSLGGSATAGAGVTWTSGRSWTFPDLAAAQGFVETYGRKATIRGQLVDGVRSRCSVLCDAIGWRPHAQLPAPDEVFAEAGPAGALTAAFGLAHATLDVPALLGRQQRRDGGRTWYLRLDPSVTGALALPSTAPFAAAGAQALLAYEVDARGRPRSLRASLAGTVAAGGIGHSRSGGGRVLELDATLDLREPADRAAAAALLEALGDPRALPARARALGARFARRGQLDRRTYAVRRTADGLGAGIGLGARLDGALDRTTDELRLLSAETHLPGLPFLPRDDCRGA